MTGAEKSIHQMGSGLVAVRCGEERQQQAAAAPELVCVRVRACGEDVRGPKTVAGSICHDTHAHGSPGHSERVGFAA